MIRFCDANIPFLAAKAAFDTMLRGDYATGVLVAQLEKAIAARYGYKNVIAVNSGTSALLLSLIALGVGPGDEVITTPYTIVSTVNPILAVGATPVFVDIDRSSYNLDPGCLEEALTYDTKAVLPVSLFGTPCDLREVLGEVPENVAVLEDACESFGAVYRGRPIGTDADIAVFSLAPNKMLPSAGGGLVVTSSDSKAEVVRGLANNGMVERGDLRSQGFGYNMQMTDPNAALALHILENSFFSRQARLVELHRLYDHTLSGDDWGQSRRLGSARSKAVEFVYTVELPVGVDKDTVIRAMCRKGVEVKPYFYPLHKIESLSAYADEGSLPVAEHVGARTIALPFHTNMMDRDIKIVVSVLREVVQRC